MENANKKKKAVISKIYFDLYFIADSMNTRYLMFCLVNFKEKKRWGRGRTSNDVKKLNHDLI